MEILTCETAKTEKEQNSVGIASKSQQDEERYRDEVNKGKEDGKDIEDKEENDGIGNAEHRSHEEEDARNTKLTVEKIAFENFGHEIDDKDNRSLESRPFLKVELDQNCERSIEVSYTVSQEATDDTVDDANDLIAKDMLCFAWQIARGMVSDGVFL